MRQSSADRDVEADFNGATSDAPMTSGKSTRAFTEAAALLTVWSVLVLNEGIIRFVGTNPSADLLGPGRPTPLVAFLGGLFEVIFGMFGLFVGAAALVLNFHSTALTKACMVVQAVFGWYVFIVYVFLIPAFGAADSTEPSIAGLSLGESRFLATLGILTSASFCLALQGGQFLFMARLVSAATGSDFLKQASGARMRAMFWNGNWAMSGLWTLVTGVLIHARVGGGRLTTVFASPPNVGLLPGLTIATGVIVLLWGLGGILLAVTKRTPMARPFATLSSVVFVVMFLNYAMVQIAIIPEGPAVAGSLHSGLSFMVAFLGPYFLVKQEEEESKGNL